MSTRKTHGIETVRKSTIAKLDVVYVYENLAVLAKLAARRSIICCMFPSSQTQLMINAINESATDTSTTKGDVAPMCGRAADVSPATPPQLRGCDRRSQRSVTPRRQGGPRATKGRSKGGCRMSTSIHTHTSCSPTSYAGRGPAPPTILGDKRQT